VIAVVDTAGVDAFDVVGYSMGSVTAMRLFGHDDRIRSAALCGAGLHFVDGYADDNLEFLRDVGAWFRSKLWSDRPEYEFIRDLAVLDAVHDFDSIGAALIGLEPVDREQLRLASFPVLVLNGEADPSDGAALAALIPGARADRAGPLDHASAYCATEFQSALVDFVTASWP
jgi:pimeloyl-ACP methyl ester carboxylesterase